MLLTFFDDITLAWLLRAQLGTFLLDIINLAAIGKRTVLAGQFQHIVEGNESVVIYIKLVNQFVHHFFVRTMLDQTQLLFQIIDTNLSR